MFLGRHKTLFSGKNEHGSSSNRIILPKKFRTELGSKLHFYTVLGRDGEIWGFRELEWEEEVKKRLEMPLTEKQARRERREFFGQAEECWLDSQGRFVLSQSLVDKASLKEEIVLVGCGDHFEIWDAGRFEYYLKEGKD